MSGYQQYLPYVSTAAALVLGFLLLLIGWNRALRKDGDRRLALLNECELSMQQIVENFPDVFWMGTPAELLYLSPRYETIWGRPLEQARKQPMASVEALHPEDRDRVIEEFNAKQELGFDIEYRIIRPEGEVRWIRNRAFPVKNAAGKVYRLAGTCQDLTQQKEIQAALRDAATHLEEMYWHQVVLQEHQRHELARELHDRVCQNLTALNINLRILSSGVAADVSVARRARFADSVVLVEATSASIRNLVSELLPPMLDDQDSVTALHWLATQVAARSGVAISVSGSQWAERPAPEVEIALFQIVQEGINNLIKYAQAKSIEITLERSGSDYVVTVEGDGLGLGAGVAGGQPLGLGIVTMRERALAVGGRFEAMSLAGRGTRFTVWVSIP